MGYLKYMLFASIVPTFNIFTAQSLCVKWNQCWQLATLSRLFRPVWRKNSAAEENLPGIREKKSRKTNFTEERLLFSPFCTKSAKIWLQICPPLYFLFRPFWVKPVINTEWNLEVGLNIWLFLIIRINKTAKSYEQLYLQSCSWI